MYRGLASGAVVCDGVQCTFDTWHLYKKVSGEGADEVQHLGCMICFFALVPLVRTLGLWGFLVIFFFFIYNFIIFWEKGRGFGLVCVSVYSREDGLVIRWPGDREGVYNCLKIKFIYRL